MIIQNGDHFDFELQHENTKPEERPDWPLPSFSAFDWAKAFSARHPSVLIEDALPWFSGALMRGYDEALSRRQITWCHRFNRWLAALGHAE